MATYPSQITVDGKRYQIDSRLHGLPQVWVHTRRGEDAVLYLTGTSLTEGSHRANVEYLRTIIRERLHDLR